MRMFVAIELPKEIKDHIFDLQKKFHSGLAKINKVHKKNLHLTLKFLGDVEDSKLEEIKSRLSKMKFEPFKLKLTELGVFPSENYIRVIWLGVEPKDKLVELQQEVDAELLDLFPEEQKFSAHLTLGRVKLIKKKKEFKEKLNEIKVEPLEFEVKHFKLMKSELTRSGPNYEELAEF